MPEVWWAEVRVVRSSFGFGFIARRWKMYIERLESKQTWLAGKSTVCYLYREITAQHLQIVVGFSHCHVIFRGCNLPSYRGTVPYLRTFESMIFQRISKFWWGYVMLPLYIYIYVFIYICICILYIILYVYPLPCPGTFEPMSPCFFQVFCGDMMM